VTVPTLVISLEVRVTIDIRGANERGWFSVLVRTGNFKGKGNSEKYPARRVFDDVGQAVDWIVGHEEQRYLNLMKGVVDETGYVSD
jgi:HAD-hyrolase-like